MTVLSAMALALPLLPAGPAAAFVGTGDRPWAVVLCNFVNQRDDPAPASYFNNEYGDSGVGTYNLEDYWKDVSFGQLSMAGTQVIDGSAADANGWYTVDETRDTWGQLNRASKIRDCENAATGDVDFDKYYGVVAVFPDAIGNMTTSLSASATSVTVPNGSTETQDATTTNYWPKTPFLMTIDHETVNVTAETNNPNGSETFSITRGYLSTTAVSHPAGTAVGVPGDLGASAIGQASVALDDGNTHQLAQVLMPNEGNLSLIAHETGHGFGYNHSRALSMSTTDYNDATDDMSAASNNYQDSTLGTSYGGGALGTVIGDKGPGLTSSNLDSQGWIPSDKRYVLPSTSQQTITLQTLSNPFALTGGGYLEARIPASFSIEDSSPLQEGADTPPRLPTTPPTCSPRPYSCTTSSYYTVDYRQKFNWDSGFPEDAVVLHVVGRDGRTYWIDQTPSGAPVGDAAAGEPGLLSNGDEYTDPAHNTYLAVNSFNGEHATVTLANGPIVPELTAPVAHGSIRYGDQFQLRSTLTVGGAPVPNAPVTINLGPPSASRQSCTALTNNTGLAQCTVYDDQAPGSVPVQAKFAGDAAYQGVTANGSITIPRVLTTIHLKIDASHLIAILRGHAVGTRVPTGLVEFLAGGHRVGSVKVPRSGKISLPYKQTKAHEDVVVSYSGDDIYLPSKAEGRT